MSLYNLPNEILLEIFNYSDIYSLIQLKCVCNRFNLLISEILVKKSNHLLVTNQMSEKFRKRCKPLLSSYSSQCIVHYNWINTICERNMIYESRHFYHPPSCGLEMTQDRLLFFNKKKLWAYNRTEDGTVKKNKKGRIIKRKCDSFISSIVCCNDVIISGHRDGSIRHWRIDSRDNKNYFQLLKVHSNAHDHSIDQIDATSQYIASSSNLLESSEIRIQKNTHEEGVSAEGNKIFDRFENSVESIAFDPTGTKLAAVRSWFHPPDLSYIIYDIRSKSYLNQINAKYGICCKLLWEDPHTTLACYENCIKKMDMRTSKFVRTWKVNEHTLSCISTDYMYTIMTGTISNNEAILWDQRISVPIQVYNVPVNRCYWITSVPFDSRHLYISSSNYIYELDFKGDNCNRNEIKAIF